jgi:hypothetical protein
LVLVELLMNTLQPLVEQSQLMVILKFTFSQVMPLLQLRQVVDQKQQLIIL